MYEDWISRRKKKAKDTDTNATDFEEMDEDVDANTTNFKKSIIIICIVISICCSYMSLNRYTIDFKTASTEHCVRDQL